VPGCAEEEDGFVEGLPPARSLVVMCREKLLTQQSASSQSSSVTMLNSNAARTAAKAMKQTLGRSMVSDGESSKRMSIGEPGLTAMLNR
jgi:hypothetical protein